MISNKSWELEGCNDRQKKNTWGNPKKNMEKNNQMRKPEKKKTHEKTWKIIEKLQSNHKNWKKNAWENLKNHRKTAIKWETWKL